jgi:hypothetical protein
VGPAAGAAGPRAGAALAYLALFAVGLGNAVESVGVFTLMPRLVSHHVGGKVGGAKEFASEAGVAAGALAAPWLLHDLGMRGTLAVLGGGLAVLALAHARRFIRLDLALPPPGGEIALLRGVPRTATITAGQPLRTLALDRETFLFAVTGYGDSSAAAHDLASQRLARDQPPGPDTGYGPPAA